ncbi:hypothetical protein BDW74DRAFT_185744 [Aspergillus multicolor]|uniref:uncharacterized protein n=1 Tax=Aspergillus multicolor TaxID=41759 RepID=UPI003CCDC7E6
MTEISAEFDGWSSYPRNLGLSVAVDAKGYDRRLVQAEKRLFADSDSDSDSDEDDNVAQMLELGFLHQYDSWGQLQVSAEFLKKLFSFLRVHPEYLDIAFLFARKSGPVEQSFSSLFSHCRLLSVASAESACSYDIGYNVKYVAAHGRSLPKDPYSVRETGVYHGFDAATQQTQWVFIQASRELQERVREYFTRPEESQAEAQITVHGIIFQAASQAWREYLVYLEGTFAKMVSRSFYSNVTGPKMEGDFEADFADIRELQLFTDKLEKLVQVLQRNVDVGQEIQTFLGRAQRHSPSSLSPVFEDTASGLQTSILQHRVHSSRIQSLISRAKGSAMLVQNILDIRATDTTAKINVRMRELAEKNARETSHFSCRKYSPNSDKIWLTGIKTIFGTNFFDYVEGNIQIASNFWIYIVMAVGMSGCTVPVWVFYQRKRKSKSRHQQEDVEACAEKV